jgi:hypothetical protein
MVFTCDRPHNRALLGKKVQQGAEFVLGKNLDGEKILTNSIYNKSQNLPP